MEGNVKKGDVWSELRSYKKKYYSNQLIKGVILLLGIFLSIFLTISTLEFSFRFGTTTRAILFVLLILSFLATFYYYLLDPILKIIGTKKGLSDEDAALKIGGSFPGIKDRLINLIQLKSLADNNSLLEAGINQKANQVSNVSYKRSIKYSENRKYLKYVLSPVSVIAVILLAYPAFLTDSTERIVKFNEEFIPEAPFSFAPVFEPYGFKNEDLTINLSLEGNAFPENVYLLNNERKTKMTPTGPGDFEFSFKKVQNDKVFRFEAAGFFSREYEISVVERPNLRNFNVQLDYPRYTGKTDERLSNIGNLEIPEGTHVQWQFATHKTDNISAVFLSDSIRLEAKEASNELYELDKKFFVSDNYLIELDNSYSKNKDLIKYYVRVIKDEYPEISLTRYQDTVLYSMVALGGNLSDDYGVNKLELKYAVTDESGKESQVNQIGIDITSGQASQGFYYQWNVDSLKLNPGDNLTYYLQVWDNDGINGSKSTSTRRFQFRVPSRKEVKAELDKSSENTENQIEKSIDNAKELEEQIKEAEERLKEKRELDWEDEKLLREILEQKDEVDQAIEELQEMNRKNELQKERFTPQTESMQEKSKMLQESMDQLMDEETQRLFDELQKLMEEDAGVEQLQKLMEQMNRKQNNMKKELERALELFKRFKLENEINEVVDELDKLAEEQEKLSNESLEKENSAENLLEKQEELGERFEDANKDIDQINDLNQELKNPEAVPDQSDLQKSIEKDQKDSKDALNEAKEKEKAGNESDSEEGKQGEDDSQKENEEGSEKNNESGDEKEKENSGSSEENNEEEDQKGQDESVKDQENSESEDQQNSGQEQSQDQETPQNSQQQRKKASQSQQKAGNKMRQMAKKLKQMQQNMQSQAQEQNVGDLRNIVHNLIKLSFDQEDLMTNFRDVNESDPGFVPLSQQQLKLRDDAKIIQDSLYSLAKRVEQIAPFITREVSSMNEHMDNAMNSLKERRKYRAVSEQQFAMTSMNNLALMLGDALEQMMGALAESQGKKKNQSNQPQESLGEMQERLNQQIQELKESGKTGRELSEELAKLAAEQARIRKALQEMQQRMEQMNMDSGELPGGDIPKKMEETEIDLVNKRLTEQLLRRQKDIITRLLEAENALRERELDNERKGETAKEYDKIIPRSFDEYLKQKEKEIEMLKTLPPKLYPYYKKEVSEYFKRIGEGQN